MNKHFDTSAEFDKKRESVILQSIGDAVIATDMNGNIILMNRVAESLTGWKSKDAKSKPIMDVFHIINSHTRKASDNPVASVLKTRKALKLDPDTVLIPRDKDEEYYINDSCAPILDSTGSIMGVVLVFRDVTKQRREEVLKEKITTDLVQRNKDHEHFATIISHDLRAPVANILSLTTMAKDKDLIKREKEFVINSLAASAERLDEVIVDLNVILSVGKQFNEKKEKVQFSKLVIDIQESIRNILDIEQPNFKLDFKRVDEIFTIKIYMYSILYNLISNSIKYRKSSAPLNITIVSDIVDGKVILKFKDNGLGIDLKNSGMKLFGLYKRFHLDKAEGKGMGLYMVKVQVEKLGGKISVKSKVNRGTEFTMVLNL
jgi:PAS domain S-box-containing protein